jgi:hypothetical protein
MPQVVSRRPLTAIDWPGLDRRSCWIYGGQNSTRTESDASCQHHYTNASFSHFSPLLPSLYDPNI